jgi:hypothetical protein
MMIWIANYFLVVLASGANVIYDLGVLFVVAKEETGD